MSWFPSSAIPRLRYLRATIPELGRLSTARWCQRSSNGRRRDVSDMAGSDVLVWTGSCESTRALQSLLTIEYSPDGDDLGSPFSRAVGLGRYSEGLTEAEVVEPSTDFASLLDGFSDSEMFLPHLIAQVGPQTQRSNAVALFYDVQKEGDFPDFSAPGVELRYIGRFSYG